jgi:hypothetical protein
VIELKKLGFPEVTRRWPEMRKPIDAFARRAELSDGSVRELADKWLRMLRFGTLEAREVVRDQEVVGYLLTRIERDGGYDSLEVRFLHVECPGTEWHAEVLRAMIELAGRHGCRIVEGQGRPGWERIGVSIGYRAKVSPGFWIEV